MLLAVPSMTKTIDTYATHILGIPAVELVRRSGRAVADVVRAHVKAAGRVVILVGSGNNGADGLAAACQLMDAYDVCVYDVFGLGQKTEEGKTVREEFLRLGGKLHSLLPADTCVAAIRCADCLIDAIFGTGFHGEIPSTLRELSPYFEAACAYKIAIDIPLGTDGADGHVEDGAWHVDTTVALSCVKAGLVSYPAKDYVGNLTVSTLGLDIKEVQPPLSFSYELTDASFFRRTLPKRIKNGHKGSFGHACIVTGSQTFRGAAHLSLHSTLRGGVGYVTYIGENALTRELVASFPEAIYQTCPPIGDATQAQLSALLPLFERATSILIGCGSGRTEGVYRLVEALVLTPGAPLVLDADAIHMLSLHDGRALLRRAKRTVILTPHPLEFARLLGCDVKEVNANRLRHAIDFASDCHCIVALKGAATVITDGRMTYINSSGSTALSKAGSGDVLAGTVASLVAQMTSLEATALAVYLHGLAADTLERELSAFGVIPSDLPIQIAKEIAKGMQDV